MSDKQVNDWCSCVFLSVIAFCVALVLASWSIREIDLDVDVTITQLEAKP